MSPLHLAAAFSKRERSRSALGSSALRHAQEWYTAIAASPLGEAENVRALAEAIAVEIETARDGMREESAAQARALAEGVIATAERACAAAFRAAREFMGRA